MPATPGRKLAKRLVSPDSGLICPDHYTGPDWVLTDGPAVAEINAAANFAPDPQQELGLDLIFAIGANGLPAAFSFCVICCRQNLKTGLLKQAAIGWLYVTDERKIVWSAHELSTAFDAQKELAELMEGSPALAKRMMTQRNRGIFTDNNSSRIELQYSGVTQQILFKARSKTGGRGLAGDKVVLDEAFALEASHTASLLPTMAARPHGQVLYASSAGLAGSRILRDVRDRGRKGTSPRMFYLEWGGVWHDCKDPDCLHPKDAEIRDLGCALDDRELWHKNNPTISTGRISEQTIADLRQELDPPDFARECMGKWDEEGDDALPPELDVKRWKAMKNTDAKASTRGVIVLDVEPDLSAGTIGVAGNGPGGKTLLVETHRPGTAWMAERVAKLKKRMTIEDVLLHPGSAAAAIGPALKKRKIKFNPMTTMFMAAATSEFEIGLNNEKFVHVGQVEFDAAVTAARTKPSGQGRLYARDLTPVPLGPVVTTSVAAKRWADIEAEAKKTPPPTPVGISAAQADEATPTPRARRRSTPDWNNVPF